MRDGDVRFRPTRWMNFTKALPIVQVRNGNGSNGNKVMLAVEIPLILLAIGTVVLRVYSRLAVKKKLAVDDVLIVLGLVSIIVILDRVEGEQLRNVVLM